MHKAPCAGKHSTGRGDLIMNQNSNNQHSGHSFNNKTNQGSNRNSNKQGSNQNFSNGSGKNKTEQNSQNCR